METFLALLGTVGLFIICFGLILLLKRYSGYVGFVISAVMIMFVADFVAMVLITPAELNGYAFSLSAGPYMLALGLIGLIGYEFGLFKGIAVSFLLLLQKILMFFATLIYTALVGLNSNGAFDFMSTFVPFIASFMGLLISAAIINVIVYFLKKKDYPNWVILLLSLLACSIVDPFVFMGISQTFNLVNISINIAEKVLFSGIFVALIPVLGLIKPLSFAKVDEGLFFKKSISNKEQIK